MSKQTSKLINRIPDLHLLVSSLPGLVSRMHVELLGKPHDSTSVLEVLLGKLDIKRHLAFSIYVKEIIYLDL